MHTTSVSLLERLREPRPDAAWRRFTWLYTPLLYDWAKRLGLQESDAADLVQDVFLTLLRKLRVFRYDPGHSFRGWLRTVVTNKWHDRQRRLQPRTGVDLGEVADPAPAQLVDDVEYRRYLVERAIQVMQADFEPVTWRACWELVHSDRPAADVARELGISVESVYSAKSRVLRRLREELQGLWE